MFLSFYNYIINIPIILITNILIIQCNSWFSMWMIMEINLISFISFLIFNKSKKFELSIYYFLIQAFNSYIFLMMFLMINYFNNFLTNIMMIIINLSMLTKLGMPPFYLWYLKMMKNLNWLSIFFLSNIQKFIPLYILNNIINMNNQMLMNINILILSLFSMILAIMNLNNNSIKLIMAYSSIIQITWMIIIMYNNEMIYFSYFIIYLIINLNLMLTFNNLNINFINQINNIKFMNKNMFILTMINLFSLASIPPTLGFLMKWISIQSMYMNFPFWLMFMLIINSIISIYFYLNISFSSLIYYFFSNKMMFKFINFNNNFNLNLINWMLMSLLIMFEIL